VVGRAAADQRRQGPPDPPVADGASWHQHGEALDCFVLRQGQAVWDGNDPSYKVYAEAARKFGCDAGYFWRMKDSVHIQLRTASVMAVHRSWAELDRLARKFI
jgi:hypothetical protein